MSAEWIKFIVITEINDGESDIKSVFTIAGTSMGRKRWWRGGLLELLVVLRILHHAVVLADGDVGEYDTEHHYSADAK